MEWLNTLLATPTIGIAFPRDQHRFLSFPPKLGNYLNTITNNGMSISYTTNNELIEISQNNKFTIKIMPNDLSVGFSYQIAAEREPGGIPKINDVNLRPYRELLDETIRVFLDIYKSYFEGLTSPINRLGVVAVVTMKQGDVPPGIKKIIDHIGLPWKSHPLNYNISMRFPLVENGSIVETCMHRLIGIDDERKDFLCLLDWQRLFKTAKAFNATTITAEISDCIKASSEYIQKFGVGELEYFNE
jgi:hypothetical protein